MEVVRDSGHRGVAGRCQRGCVCIAREGAGPGEAEAVNWTGLLTNSTYAPKPGVGTAKNDAPSPPFFSSSFSRDAEEWRIDFTRRRMK